MTCHSDETRVALGAYALGTLEPADQQRVETHLAACPACLAELADLRSVLPALATLSHDDVSPPALSQDLFSRIVDAIDTEDVRGQDQQQSQPVARPAGSLAALRRVPRRWLVAVAASIVLLAGAGTAVGIALSPAHPTTTVASASAGGVSLRVAATDTGSGARLELTATGLPQHERCRLVALAADGTRHDAGSWNADYEGSAQVVETTDIPRSQLRRLTLYGTDGTQLLIVNT